MPSYSKICVEKTFDINEKKVREKKDDITLHTRLISMMNNNPFAFVMCESYFVFVRNIYNTHAIVFQYNTIQSILNIDSELRKCFDADRSTLILAGNLKLYEFKEEEKKKYA